MKECNKIDFIGVGPQKTGSSWLHETLKDHPNICLPIVTKELQFFDRYYSENLKGYFKYFKHCQPRQICGEITPGYFDEALVPARIAKHFPSAKIIVSLRHPVKRTESLFLHHLRKGRISTDFQSSIKSMPRIINSGKYQEHLLRWLSFFPKEQIKVILMEDIAAKPELVLQDILNFFAVDSDYTSAYTYQKVNKAGMTKYPFLARKAANAVEFLKKYQLHQIVTIGKAIGLHRIYDSNKEIPSVSHENKLELLKLYEPDIVYVENFLNRKLPFWRTF